MKQLILELDIRETDPGPLKASYNWVMVIEETTQLALESGKGV